MTQWNKARGRNLAAWRVRHDMTQVALADKIGVGKSTISRWERGESAPKPEQIDALHAVVDALGGEAASRDDAPEAVTIDVRGAELVCDEATLVELAARPIARGVDVDAPKVDPYATTIDWQALVVEVDGQRGISLRGLVGLGLYAHYRDAVHALRAGGHEFAEVSAGSARTGPERVDHLLTIREAQRLCVRARTEVGQLIAELILDHHDEFQRLIRGDAEAHARLADAQPAPQPPSDPLLAMLAAAADIRRDQLAAEARLAALEHQMARVGERLSSVDAIHDARTLRPGEVYLSAAARHHGWLTASGHAYPYAIRLSLACAGRPDYGVRRVLHPSPHDGQADVEAYVISQDALLWWRDHVRPYHEGQAVAGQVRIEPTDAAREVGMSRAANLHVRVGE